MLAETVEDITPRAEALAAAIREAAPSLYVSVEEGESYAGSGALPVKSIPSRVVEMDPPDGIEAGAFARRLRTGDVALFLRVGADRLYIDPRTLQPGEDDLVVQALVAAIA